MNAKEIDEIVESIYRDLGEGWGFTNAAPLARTRDPDTSKAAAQSLTQSGARSRQKDAILEFLKDPKSYSGINLLFCRTAHEISQESGIEHPVVHKRLPDLRRDGLVVNGPVRKCNVTGRQSLTWKVKA